jgi:hypothetical protein
MLQRPVWDLDADVDADADEQCGERAKHLTQVIITDPTNELVASIEQTLKWSAILCRDILLERNWLPSNDHFIPTFQFHSTRPSLITGLTLTPNEHGLVLVK